MAENGYRRLRHPSCGFKADRDIVGKLNIRKRASKISEITGEVLTPSPPLWMKDESPNRWET
jgi:hypothetical protein